MGAADVTWCKRSLRLVGDSGAAKSVWPIREKGVSRTKATKTVVWAEASGSPIRVEGEASLECVRDGSRRGKRRRVRTAGSVHREQEHWPRDSTECNLDAQAGSRMTKNVGFDEPNTNEMMPVFRRPPRTRMWKEFVNAVRPQQTVKQDMKHA